MKKKFLSILLILVMCLQLLPPTTALAASGDKYLENMQLLSAKKNGVPLSMLNDDGKTYKEFEFDPNKTEYNIVLPDGLGILDYTQMQFISTLKEEPSSDGKIAGKWSTDTNWNNGDESDDLLITAASKSFTGKSLAITGSNLKLNTSVSLMKAPYTLKYTVGSKTASGSGVVKTTKFESYDSYIFNFYVRATLKSLSANDGKYTATTFTAYDNNITLDKVAPDTKDLTINAEAVSEADKTTLKFDDGTGKYSVYKIEPDTKTVTIDLSNYSNAKYKMNDGGYDYYVIPFMLDYSGNDKSENVAGVDGYYTLTVNLNGESEQETDYTPSFSSVPDDVSVKAGESVTLTVEVTPEPVDGVNDVYKWYSADNSEGNDKVLIPQATESSYTPSTAEPGTTYYFCEVTRNANGKPYDPILSKGIKVAVRPADSKFVENIKILSASDNEYVIFDSSSYPDSNNYTVSLPYIRDGRPYKMIAEYSEAATSNNKMRVGVSLKPADGDSIYSSEYKLFTNDYNLFGDARVSSSNYKNEIYSQKPGNYVFQVEIYEIDGDNAKKPGTSEVYTFNINIFPNIDTLQVSVDGKQLNLDPPLNYDSFTSRFIKEYTTQVLTGTTKITLNSQSNSNGRDGLIDGEKFIYKTQDKTNEIKSDAGFEIVLAECAKDDQNRYTIPFSIAYNDEKTEYVLYVTEVAGSSWQITQQPQGGTYNKDDIVELKVAINANDGTVTYQWQYGFSTSTFFDIPAANSATYNAPTNNGGPNATRYYRCVITDKATGMVAYSDYAKVEVNLGQVSAPEITNQPKSDRTTYKVGEKVDPIQASVKASEGDSNTDKSDPVRIEMQWYYNTKRSTADATPLSNSDFSSNSYTKSGGSIIRHWNCAVSDNLSVGKHYYYFVATAVSNEDGNNRASVTSDFFEITIVNRDELTGFKGKGTEQDPYLIESADQFKKIDECVLNGDFLGGAVFKMTQDIELPQNWEPIGDDKGGSGKNLFPFSGTIDGDGHKLTVAKGGRPLLEYARDAVVRNLKIYGEEINGAGLLEKGTIDYGPDGIYQELTDPDVITLENVTLLTGSKTKHSGLVYGGFTSGINDIVIKDCVIEPGVIVGYDKQQNSIGSFVGTFNGRIINSISYADVYGVDHVGGLAANKGQSMGACEVVNSTFLGKIEATGGRVGGILASGYISDSAPSTPPITIRNCYVAADITANTANGGAIGGILGSEEGATGLKNRGAISDNHFYGTITDTNPDTAERYRRVGGILGRSGKYNGELLTYKNNYYLVNENYTGLGSQAVPVAEWTPETESFIAKNADEFANGNVLALLNEGEYKNWKQDTKYPIVDVNIVVPVALTISGNYKTQYYIGDELDLTSAVFMLNLSDGSKKVLDLSDIKITGYDKNTRAVQTLTATYQSVSTLFEVTVLKRPAEDPANPQKPGVDPNIIRVYLTIMGDTNHGEDGGVHTLKKGGLQTWIPRSAFDVDLNATVWDVLEEALTAANISWKNPDGNYVESITYNGMTLAEFTNGPNSGWMYTLNGHHSDLGVSEQFLENGDVIIFHYTDDYTLEDGSEQWIIPGTGNKEKEEPPTISPTVTPDASGETKAEIDPNAMKDAVADAKQTGAGEIVIEPQVKGDADKVTVELPKTSAGDIADAGLDLTVETDKGSVTLPPAALKDLGGQSGSSVSVSVEEKKDETGKATGETAIEVKAGNTTVDQLSGGIKASLPAVDEGDVLVIVEPDGTKAVVKKSVVENGHIEALLDGSCTVKVIDNSTEFADVADGAWYAGAVDFASSHELFDGVGGGAFAPGGTMTRGMLATVLWRLENEEEVTIPDTFADVAQGSWYEDGIVWANEHGIVTGYGGNKFGPGDNITREQLATMLWRYAKDLGMDVTASGNQAAYKDSGRISGYAEEAVQWAVGAGLLTGKGGGVLDPGGNATRAEVATIMERLVGIIVK